MACSTQTNIDATSSVFDPLWQVPLSLILLPGSLVHVVLFKKNKFEEKLWKNKRTLDTVLAQGSIKGEIAEFLCNEVDDFANRYDKCLSPTMRASLNYFAVNYEREKHETCKNTQDLTRHAMLCYSVWLNDIYSRELLRVGPLRYLWKETDKLVLLGIPTVIALRVIPHKQIAQQFYKENRRSCLTVMSTYLVANIIFAGFLAYKYRAGSSFNPVSKHQVRKH